MPPEQRLPLAPKGPNSAPWWVEQLKWSADITEKLLPDWRYHARAYIGDLKPVEPGSIRVNIEFEKTEQKKPQLLYRIPDFRLKATPRTRRDAAMPDPMTGQQRDLKRAIAIFREALKYLVGPKGADLKAAMDEMLFDVLCPSGIAAAKIGYERFTDEQNPVMVPTGRMIDNPNAQPSPGDVLGLNRPQIPEMGPVPNVLAEKYYCTRISPPMLRFQPDFRHSRYRQTDWIGHKFYATRAFAERMQWPLSPTIGESSMMDDKDRILELPTRGQRAGQIAFTEVFYYPLRVDGSAKHPDHIRRLIFVDGETQPIVHTDFKDQKWSNGKLVGGLRAHPIFAWTLRYVSDMPYPPSDCKITRMQGDELSDFRTQQMMHRRRSQPMVGYDITRIHDDRVKEKLLKGEYCGQIPFNGPVDDQIMRELARGQYPQENAVAADMVMGDVNRLWALGANASSTREAGGVTATEIATIAEATANRLGSESQIVQDVAIEIIEMFAALAQIYADREDLVEIVGEQGAEEVATWDRETVAGEFLFEAIPDSAKRPDAAGVRDLALNRYNLVRNDPNVNGEQLLRETLEDYGSDEVDVLVRVPEPPPPPSPDPPRVAISFSGQDLALLPPELSGAIMDAAGIAAPGAPAPPPGGEEPPDITAAPVVDRERLRMAEADNEDARVGGFVGTT